MTIKLIFCWILSVGFALPLSAMDKKKKVMGAIQTVGCAGAVAAGALNTIQYVLEGASLTNQLPLLALNGVGLGIYALGAGIEKLCANQKDANLTVEGGQLLIQYKDPTDGKLVYQKYSGAEINRFLENNGFIITWRDDFPYSKRAEEYQKVINDELEPLLASNGRPSLYGQLYQIRNDQLRQAHAQAIVNPAGVDTLANELAQKENLFAALRRRAVYSYGRPAQGDKLHLFTKPASQAMAKLMLVTAAAMTYPYEELVRTIRAEKEAAQAEFRGERNNFVAERGIRNQLQTDLNAEQADKARIQARNRLTLSQAVQQSCDIEAARAETQSFLEEADREAIEKEEEKETILDSYRDRIIKLNEHKNRTVADAVAQTLEVAEQRADLEEENGTLRQQLRALQQQLTNSQKVIRKQSKDNRRTVNKLQVLQRAQQK